MTTGKRAELEHQVNLIETRLFHCANEHGGGDGEWIDGTCITPMLAANEIMYLFDQCTTTVAEEAKTVNRFEVINHMSDGSGRQVTVWHSKSFKVEPSLQDDGRTLKIFLTDIEQLTAHQNNKEAE